jgi:DNA-binding HxlR family transcriptional regulator
MIRGMHPERGHYSAENCSIQAALDIVGEKWTLLVVREAFFGVRRFADFQRLLGCARNILSARLKTLVDAGILSLSPYREPGSRARYEYRLTEKGRDLYPIVVSLMQWGDRWGERPDGAPLQLTHRDCGQAVEVQLRCAADHGPLSVRDVQARAGAGAKAA